MGNWMESKNKSNLYLCLTCSIFLRKIRMFMIICSWILRKHNKMFSYVHVKVSQNIFKNYLICVCSCVCVCVSLGVLYVHICMDHFIAVAHGSQERLIDLEPLLNMVLNLVGSRTIPGSFTRARSTPNYQTISLFLSFMYY